MNAQRLWQRLSVCLQFPGKTLTFLIADKGSNEATDQPKYGKEHDYKYPGTRRVTGLLSLRPAKSCAKYAGDYCLPGIEYTHSASVITEIFGMFLNPLAGRFLK